MSTVPGRREPRVPPPALSTSGQRAYAATRVASAAEISDGRALMLVDCLDQAIAGALRACGLTDEECRNVLFAMYGLGEVPPAALSTLARRDGLR